VQLKPVGIERRHDRVQQRVIRIDRERDLAGTPGRAVAECACRRHVEMARGGRKEHEADEIGTRFERGVEGYFAVEPADLDQQ